MKQALILAGGKGTRLSSLFPDIPKPMVPVAGKPVLQYAVENLAKSGITDLHFFTGHKSEIIEEYFGDGKKFGVTVTYHIEKEPLGSAGSVIQTLAQLDEEFLVVYGDTIFNIDFSRYTGFHQKKNSEATIFLQPCDHMFDSDLVDLDSEGRITKLHACPHTGDISLPNMANAAMYILKRETLLSWATHQGPLDFAHDIVPALISQKRELFGYVSREYIRDMGTPERLKNVEADVAAGRLERGSLATKRPALFIDRDGTLVRYAGFIRRPEDLVLEEGSAEAIQLINKSEYLAVLVTNQALVARGEISEEGLQEIHKKMEQDLGHHRAYLDRIYFCPHYSERDFAEGRAGDAVPCDCRKPKFELIQRAVQDLHIDIENSWIIGDTTIDLMTAKNAGIKSVLVHTGEAGKDAKFEAKSDIEAANLLAAVRFLLFDGGTKS